MNLIVQIGAPAGVVPNQVRMVVYSNTSEEDPDSV